MKKTFSYVIKELSTGKVLRNQEGYLVKAGMTAKTQLSNLNRR
jgi:hypothetical protein